MKLKEKTVENRAIELFNEEHSHLTTKRERLRAWAALPGFGKQRFRHEARTQLINAKADTDTVEESVAGWDDIGLRQDDVGVVL